MKLTLTHLMARVEIAESGCWEWQRALLNGYASASVNGVRVWVHRVAYEMMRGTIPPGIHIDHLCRNPRCINPDHLEPVTPRENLLRSDNIAAKRFRSATCSKGHELSGYNLEDVGDGRRRCRTCRRHAGARYKSRKRAEGAAIKASGMPTNLYLGGEG